MKRCLFLLTSILLIFQITIPLAKAGEGFIPSISSEAAVLIDAESGNILYEKNSEELMYPASITKIATAIYAIENGALDDIVTVSERARNVDGTKVYLETGEQVSLLMLIQGMMINSGNDASVAIAEHLSGTVEQFSDDLNAYLKEKAGVENTNFTNPHGLFDLDHQTTALDMAKITQYALQNEIFREIFGTAQMEWKVQTWDTTIYNHHKLIVDTPYEGVIGGKNGYVEKSGFTLVTAAERDNLDLIVVTMKAETDNQSYQDTVKLLDYGFKYFQRDEIAAQTFTSSSGKEFALEEPVEYTKKIAEEVTEEISNSGKLIVKGEDGRVLSEIKLTKVEEEQVKPEVQVLAENVESPNTSSLHAHFSTIVSISFIVVFLLVGFLLLQVRKI